MEDIIEIFFWNTKRKEIYFQTSEFEINSGNTEYEPYKKVVHTNMTHLCVLYLEEWDKLEMYKCWQKTILCSHNT